MRQKISFLKDLNKHRSEVQENINNFVGHIKKRAVKHDLSKFQEPEFSLLSSTYNEFQNVDYGTPEYEELARRIKPAIDHHYANNRHHCAHFPNGVSGMNLVDVVEMIADWKSVSKRSKKISFIESLPIAFKKYNITGQLKDVILNTIKDGVI